MSIKISIRRAALVLGALGISVPPALANVVRIVDGSGQRNYRGIQEAINAAVDGDVLLVAAGNYQGFTVDGKSLSIFAAPPGAAVSIGGTVNVANVIGTCVLTGFGAAGLGVANCSGLVAFQDCSFANPSCVWCPPALVGGFWNSIGNCAAVVLSGCHFQGYDGRYGWNDSIGEDAGGGCLMISSAVAAYDCTFRGGKGGPSFEWGGTGGQGLRLESSWLFASACAFLAGDGGDGTDPFAYCGAGGDGLVGDAASEAHLLGITAAGGAPGTFCGGMGGNGSAISGGGQFYNLPGTPRRFHVPFITMDNAPYYLTVAGVTDDRIFVNRSLVPVFQYDPALSGVCTSLLPPFPPNPPIGFLRFTTSQDRLQLKPDPLPDSVFARMNFLQGYVLSVAGPTVLGNPMYTLSLNWDSLPDCNGNGIQDYAEVIAGITPDVNHDLVPDGCP